MLIFTSENFEKEVLQSDKPVLVDFFATWCGPCKAMHPVLEELDLEEDFKVGQVDIDELPGTGKQISHHVRPVLYCI